MIFLWLFLRVNTIRIRVDPATGRIHEYDYRALRRYPAFYTIAADFGRLFAMCFAGGLEIEGDPP